MAVLYKSFQSVLEDKNHKKMFHPRVIYTANISTSQIAKEIAAYSSLSPGDVKKTLDNLVTVMGQHLQASESVSLDGFGTFRMVMKSNGKGVETSEELQNVQEAGGDMIQGFYFYRPQTLDELCSRLEGQK